MFSQSLWYIWEVHFIHFFELDIVLIYLALNEAMEINNQPLTQINFWQNC